MADQSESKSILAQHVEARRRRPLYGAALAEVSAVAYDLSAMMATVVPMLRILSESPAIANSPDGIILKSMAQQLNERFEAHSVAMAELNRAR
jgi:hypothetical protein